MVVIHAFQFLSLLINFNPFVLAENTNLRRSLPNVSQRLTQPQGHHASDPYLDNYSSGGSDDYEVSPTPAQQRQFSRLQPPVRPTSPNVSGLRQPSSPMHRGLSPQRTGLPQPMRRSIPRPDSAVKSSIPSPRRSVKGQIEIPFIYFPLIYALHATCIKM